MNTNNPIKELKDLRQSLRQNKKLYFEVELRQALARLDEVIFHLQIATKPETRSDK